MSSRDESTSTPNNLVRDVETTPSTPLGLKRVTPYWTPLRTMAKGRWINREILEMVSTEFRDRSIEYYVRGSGFLNVSSVIWLSSSVLLWKLV